MLRCLTWKRFKIDRLRDEAMSAPECSTLVRESTKTGVRWKLQPYSTRGMGSGFVLSRTASPQHSCFRGP